MVRKFLNKECEFLDIANGVFKAVDYFGAFKINSIDDVFEIDLKVRELLENFWKDMMRKILLLAFALSLYALEFTISENGKSLGDNNTILIFGGMQGDEPGGFHAAIIISPKAKS